MLFAFSWFSVTTPLKENFEPRPFKRMPVGIQDRGSSVVHLLLLKKKLLGGGPTTMT